MKEQTNLFSAEEMNGTCRCGRCGAPCRITPKADSRARLLRRGKTPKGLCVNCAAHDVLRNTYPINLQLAGSGPQLLAHPHIQKMFFDILKSAGTDAEADEINWAAVIENWDLPFPTKLKSSAMNPVIQAELDREPDERKQREERAKRPRMSPEEHDRKVETIVQEELMPLLRKFGRHKT